MRIWSTVLGRSSFIGFKSPDSKNLMPYVEIAPCPVIPSHSASRRLHVANSSCNDEFRRTGARQSSNSIMEVRLGATVKFSPRILRVKARTRAALTRSSSGPKAATFLVSARPTRPLTREVVNHADAKACQRSAGVCISQTSNLLLGIIRSWASMLISEVKLASSVMKAAQGSSTPRCVAIILRSRTPKPPARKASAGSSAQKLSNSSTQRNIVEIFAIAARLI